MLRSYIAQLVKYQHLSEAQAEEAMNLIMRGEATPAQIGAYLIALRMKGETPEEILGSARAMRAHATPVP
jgi:anthranilate phosphoribosyltransferase